MAERYSRLFTLPQNLYNESSPVLIAAGALLKDNVTGAVLAQLKLKSLSEKDIKAVTVGVVPLDTAGRELSEAIVYNYLDLNVQRNAEFGQKKAISLPDSTARSFKAYVSEVIFDDNSIYSAPECDWTPLDTEQVELETELGNDELIKQFRMTYGNDYRYLPKNQRDLWLCTCGAINHAAESKCHNCGREHVLFESLDINAIKTACEERLEAERIAAEKAKAEAERKAEERRIAEEKRRKEAEIAAKKRNKIMLIVTAACACVAVALLITQVIVPNNKYNNAVALMNNGNYEEAITGFDALNGYKDSAEQITECTYLNAVVLMADEEYDEAIALFDALNGYKDSIDQITECSYLKAVALMNNGNYEEAIVAFDALNGYKDSTDQITECNYLKAVALMDNGNYEEAIAIFDALNGYKDSAEQIASCKLACELINMRNADVDDYVYFGSYEQDNDTSNGKEDIEWLVLDKQDSKVLLLSRYGLDKRQYNTDQGDITWENCTLRTWLNKTFINNAFSSAEQQCILLTGVDNSRSQCYSGWDTNGGNNTHDKVFLLSYAEANKYLDVTDDDENNTRSRVAPTDYTIAQGIWQSKYYKTRDGLCAGWWWLRSPGNDQYPAACVGDEGSLSSAPVHHFGCVRPALWIDLN